MTQFLPPSAGIRGAQREQIAREHHFVNTGLGFMRVRHYILQHFSVYIERSVVPKVENECLKSRVTRLIYHVEFMMSESRRYFRHVKICSWHYVWNV